MASYEIFLKFLAAGAVTLAVGALVPAALTLPDPAAGRPPPAPPAYTLALSPDRGHVDLTGRIDFGATADLSELLEGTPGVHTLRLESPGGRVAEARGLVRVVRLYALATEVTGDCASACTLVFIAGHRRTLGGGGRLGFHGYNLRSAAYGLIDPAAEMKRDSRVFRDAGVDAAFIARAMAVPHQTMWFPERGDLIAAGVIAQGTDRN